MRTDRQPPAPLAAHGPVRALRAVSLTTAVVATGAVSHHAAAGGTPTVDTVALLAVLVGPVAWILTARRVGPLATTALLATGQALSHLLALGGTGAVGTVAAGHHGAHHVAGGPGPSLHGVLPGPAMLAAHAVALVVTVALVRYAEGALFGLARELGRALHVPGAITLAAIAPTVTSPAGRADLPAPRAADPRLTRGPPRS